jgi:hypothetical protein
VICFDRVEQRTDKIHDDILASAGSGNLTSMCKIIPREASKFNSKLGNNNEIRTRNIKIRLALLDRNDGCGAAIALNGYCYL